jgi:DNA adenine methylase
MSETLTPPLKWHGGKHYLARRIIELMPPHIHYVEPYFGGGSVLLAKEPEGISEVVNDLNKELTEFWLCLQDPSMFGRFWGLCQATPFSEVEWALAGGVPYTSRAFRGYQFFVRCRLSLAGRMDTFAPLSRRRTRRGMNEQAAAWLSAVEGLPQVHERLKRVVILNRPALDVIDQQDGPDTLFYLDPPYLHETRSTTHQYGPYEMTKHQHIDLMAALCRLKGKFLLSGYRSELYDGYAHAEGWTRHDFELPNNAASGDSKRRMTESLWCNF